TPTPTPTPTPEPTPTPTPTATPTPTPTPLPSVTPTPSTGPDIPIDTDNDVPLGGIPPITKPETLPKTGESSHLYVEIAGITLILLGLILRRRFTR
ncbi:LPXTG cell wall anchor domain-containing protein, partial [Paenibacillus alginolyticus]